MDYFKFLVFYLNFKGIGIGIDDQFTVSIRFQIIIYICSCIKFKKNSRLTTERYPGILFVIVQKLKIMLIVI